MTLNEFETRTKVNVTAAEFETINAFYMACEADKDEFCNMWRKLNPARVKAAKVEALAAAREQARRDTLWGIVNRGFSFDDYNKYADEMFKPYELFACEAAGMELNYDTRVNDVVSFANNYLAR